MSGRMSRSIAVLIGAWCCLSVVYEAQAAVDMDYPPEGIMRKFEKTG